MSEESDDEGTLAVHKPSYHSLGMQACVNMLCHQVFTLLHTSKRLLGSHCLQDNHLFYQSTHAQSLNLTDISLLVDMETFLAELDTRADAKTRQPKLPRRIGTVKQCEPPPHLMVESCEWMRAGK